MKKYLALSTVFLSLFIFAKTARAESFTAYLNQAQEVPASGSAATGKALIVINETALTITYSITFTNLSSAQILGHIHGPAAVGANAGVQITFPVIGGTSGTISGTLPITAAQISQIRSGLGYVNIHSTNFTGGEIRGQLAKNRWVDFDGDGRTDFSIVRYPPAVPPDHAPMTFWNLRSTDGSLAQEYGDATTDFLVPGDYDGDGKDDIAVFRQDANWTVGADTFFLILRSSDSTFQAVRWGVTGDRAIPRDYDGDGITDMAVFRQGAAPGDPAFWYIRQSAAGFVQRSVQWGTTGDIAGGTSGDIPVPGDYDGDGKFDLAVYRFGGLTPTNTFIILRSSNSTTQFVQWGIYSSDWIAPGDYDGDGKFDFCTVRANPSPATWQILRSSDGVQVYTLFGRPADRPVSGDYDGDGRTDIAVYRRGALSTDPSTFFYIASLDNTARQTIWGLRADFPTANLDNR